ncbi:hypothetical protein Axi01nite_81510 [Actinoplanes xinjiangensis]|nr:hypothetical protein Axi01nite_81510 [Actinoplanes xinjiangensis]
MGEAVLRQQAGAPGDGHQHEYTAGDAGEGREAVEDPIGHGGLLREWMPDTVAGESRHGTVPRGQEWRRGPAVRHMTSGQTSTATLGPAVSVT